MKKKKLYLALVIILCVVLVISAVLYKGPANNAVVPPSGDKPSSEQEKDPVENPANDKPAADKDELITDTGSNAGAPPKPAPTEEELINQAAGKIVISVENVQSIYLKDVSLEQIKVSGFDQSKYKIIVQFDKDLSANTLFVSVRLGTKDGGLTSKPVSKLISGFKVEDNKPPLAAPELVVSASEFTLMPNESISFTVRLDSKPEAVKSVSLELSSSLVSLSSDSLTFTPEDYAVEKVIQLTSNIGSNSPQAVTLTLRMNGAQSKTIKINLEKESAVTSELIKPFSAGVMKKPLYYYTAYYDVDYTIEKLFYRLPGSNWVEIVQNSNGSYTQNACMIAINASVADKIERSGIELKAEYKEKVSKLQGEPVLTLEGYRIKATLNGEVEYFTPSAVIPTPLVNEQQEPEIQNYKVFTRKNYNGDDETFYLALRPKSNSRFVIDGLSPTNFEKVFEVSQDINRKYYQRLLIYYTKDNPAESIKFFDATDKSDPEYGEWRMALRESVDTFNQCFNGFGIHIEEVTQAETDNFVNYRYAEEGYAGMTRYSEASNQFSITVNNDVNLLKTYASLKSTIVHELGHLVGFSDSAYAINDSLYSYSRDSLLVTYFQPNDIATLKMWLKK